MSHPFSFVCMFAAFLLLSACGSSVETSLQGHWVSVVSPGNDETIVFDISANEIKESAGGFNLAFKYRVVAVSGKDVTIERDAVTGPSAKVKIIFTVDGDTLIVDPVKNNSPAPKVTFKRG
jgi:hypothetical protein